MPLDTQHIWRCSCGRSVPARAKECHCGARRAQVLQSRRSEASATEGKGRARRLVLAALAFLVAVVGAGAWVARVPPSAGAPVPGPTEPVATQPAAPPEPAPNLVAEPRPAFFRPARTPEPPSPPEWAGAGPGGATPEPTPAAATPAPANTPSEMDVLRQKAERWRERYHPVVERIASLEAEISKLEEEDRSTVSTKTFGNPYDNSNPNLKTGGERTHERLLAARAELAQARRELTQIEDDARRDGVPSGQLY